MPALNLSLKIIPLIAGAAAAPCLVAGEKDLHNFQIGLLVERAKQMETW